MNLGRNLCKYFIRRFSVNRLGFFPVVFEKTHELGDKPGYMVTTLRLFQKGFKSPMEYIWNHYGLNISPLHPIKEIVMITPNRKFSSKANHGYVFIKGIAENSLEHQLAAHAKLQISFDTNIDPKKIRNEYDYIVVATANSDFVEELGIWNNSFTSSIRIASISGDFKVNTMTMWLNKNYARNGFGYLLARNPAEAELVLAVSDIEKSDLDIYWKTFIKVEKLDYQILKTHDIKHIIGYPDVRKLENFYFVGNTGGMIDNFLGFGMIKAIDSGILAARAIVENLDYDKLLKPYVRVVKQLYEYRKMLNVLTNKDYDTDISILGLPVIKHMVYNNPLYKAKIGILAPKLICAYKTFKNKKNI